MKKRLIILSGFQCWQPFQDLFTKVVWANDAQVITKNDLLLFEGGNDVSPFFYREPNFACGPLNSDRDIYESRIFYQARQVNARMLGICRGSQFLTVMNGGKVIQHVNGHTQSHMIETFANDLLSVTSTHHQMMNPFELKHQNYKLIAWAYPKRSDKYLNGYGEQVNMPVEPEIVWYPKTKCLCIQGHPEYLDQKDEFVKYSRKLIKEYLL